MFYLDVCLYTICVSSILRGQGSLESGITCSCEPPCGCQETNPGPLEEQPVILTSDPIPYILVLKRTKKPIGFMMI